MTIVRWNPWNDLFSLHEQMDQLFTQNLSQPTQRQGDIANLPVDIRQTDEAFYIEASIPGIKPEDVEVTFDEGVVAINALARVDDEQREGGYVRRERRTTSLYRQVALPAEVRSEDIRASFEHGVLTVQVPRAQKAQPRRIPVTTEGPAAGRVIDAPKGASTAPKGASTAPKGAGTAPKAEGDRGADSRGRGAEPA